MNGLNLHHIVRGCIPPVHPDEKVLLIQNVGKVNVRGVVTATFADAVQVIAQIQSMGTDDLRAMNEVSRTEIQRKFWLYSATPNGVIPNAIVRQLERGGDMIRRANGSWWLVAGLMEDFSASGWVSVRCVRQIDVPAGARNKAQEWDAKSKGADDD